MGEFDTTCQLVELKLIRGLELTAISRTAARKTTDCIVLIATENEFVE